MTNFIKFLVIGFFSLGSFSCSSPIEKETPASFIPDEQAEIESGIIKVVTFEGEEDERLTLTERQEELGVPQTSVAIAKDWQIHWARAYGENANTDTRFQAASLSKTVAAVGLITLAEDLDVGLEDDISDDLESIGIRTLNPDNLPITLNRLLSHTNGATVSGFRGYPIGSSMPDSKQIVSGLSPANSDPVVILPNPESERRYSGGGYQIAQLWAETKTGESFEHLMQRLVIKPVEMPNSTFSIVNTDVEDVQNHALAHDYDGSVIGSGWYVHPEQAAAGLWTTPKDYAKFVLHLMRAAKGQENSGIRTSVAKEILTPVIKENGMGLGVQTRQGEMRLMKSGLNQGFICTFMAFPERGDVIVAMTNSKKGFPMIGDINRTANQVYGWPSSPLIFHKRSSVDEKELSQFIGDYSESNQQGVAFTLTQGDNLLIGTTPSGYRFNLVKIGENTFVDPADAEVATFSFDAEEKLIFVSGKKTYVSVSDAK